VRDLLAQAVRASSAATLRRSDDHRIRLFGVLEFHTASFASLSPISLSGHIQATSFPLKIQIWQYPLPGPSLDDPGRIREAVTHELDLVKQLVQ
jgi:hypothetical protein